MGADIGPGMHGAAVHPDPGAAGGWVEPIDAILDWLDKQLGAA